MRVENWPENVVLVHLPHELQKHAELQTVIDTVGERGGCDVIVDFSDADIVGSPTFSRLLELRDVLRRSGHRLILCNVAPATRGAFVVAQLDRLFGFAEDEAAVFIWNPQGIRSDLGSPQAVAKAFNESQTMARNAGFGGMMLMAMGNDFSQSHINPLKQEGYFGITTYHEWGSGIDVQVTHRLFSYEDVVREGPTAWEKKNQAANGLTYYPLVDTGWDSRPWHGYRAMVVQDRTPARFEELLCQVKAFCKENGKDMVILGPVNEWGEGGYIEPCTEFGFEMLEAIRNVFATGSAAEWPINVAPGDVGLGPYDFPAQQP